MALSTLSGSFSRFTIRFPNLQKFPSLFLKKSSYGCSWKNMIQTTQYPSSLFSIKIFLFLGMQTLESSIQRQISR
ncbi:hypothetical protein RchiOBHm_Chr7g0180631 [Rosa chinensis]|uniref:Uncharacterized protein n=1 Tax=Rosa chinensis TaxID=74649 RepID=A0A2P6P2F5_ROSCH|nr:hypothetical protein RchiOBHm_Chr7g0180631 [Rosa chinensis]